MHTRKVIECDRKILHYLWRWKLMSTSGIAAFLYGKADAEHAYRRLLILQKLRLINIKTNNHGSKVLWTLSEKGYQLIKPGLPNLSDAGFRSESPAHDFLSSVIHVGPWIYNTPKEIQTFTEQELRRIDPQEFPDWVPKDHSHRSDGYWRVPIAGKPHILSLEVELSRQTQQRYHEVARYYERNTNISRALWVVKNQNRAAYIHHCIQEENQSCTKFHNFILYPDFLENGWSCQLRLGAEDGKPMSILFKEAGNETTPVPYPKRLLDMSKNPTESNSYKLFNLEDFRL